MRLKNLLSYNYVIIIYIVTYITLQCATFGIASDNGQANLPIYQSLHILMCPYNLTNIIVLALIKQIQ